jgi:ABC-type polysaccharide/polyol phosphate export permease
MDDRGGTWAVADAHAKTQAGLSSAADANEVAEPSAPVEPPRELWYRPTLDVRKSLVEVWDARELIWTLGERDLRARYKQAALGFVWALITPLTLMLVFTLVFSSGKVTKLETDGVPYPIFSYVGLIVWTFFSACVLAGGLSIVSNMPILNKTYCPREVFPLATVIVAAVDTAMSVAVLALLFAIYGYTPHIEIVYAPLLLGLLLVFTVGVMLWLSSLIVYLRDLRLALPLVLQLGLFLTPVAYGAAVIADTERGMIVYSAIDPLVPVIDGLRRTILHGTPPQWLPMLAAAFTSLVVLVSGFVVFKRLEPGIADIA